jgi:hypothetical protein
VAKKCTLCPEYKDLCLGQIQDNTSLSTTLHIFKHGGGFVILWVCLSSARTMEFFGIKRNRVKLNTGRILAKNWIHYQNKIVLDFTVKCLLTIP